jgi:hypothetical protein
MIGAGCNSMRFAPFALHYLLIVYKKKDSVVSQQLQPARDNLCQHQNALQQGLV